MPSFFVGGRSGFREHFGGDARRQIDAIWSYLSQGELLPLPEGLADPGGLDLEVADEPVVLRTFMADGGVRAIACGYPEQIHCAFDADRCRLSMVWEGQFLNAQGAWAARGGSETNPQGVVWTAPGPLFASAGPQGGGPGTDAVTRFRGYRLNEHRRPTFDYDLLGGGIVINVSEQPVPRHNGTRASLIRHFTLQGPAGARVRINVTGHERLQGLEPPPRGEPSGASPPADGVIEVRLDGQGRGTLDLEVTW